MHSQGYTRVTPPIPDWKYGQRVDATEAGRQYLAGAEGGFEGFEVTDDNVLDIFSLMITGITPRAIAFISTRSEDGVDNLAPYSFFTVANVNPPIVTFSALYEPNMKDTARDVLATKNFVVNIPSPAWIHQANATSMNSPFGVSEWEFCGLTKEKSDVVSAPRVKESAFSLECELYHHFQITDQTSKPSAEIFYGRVRRVHLRKDMLVFSPHHGRPQVDTQKLNPVSRLGEIAYATLGESFRILIPKWINEGERALHESHEQSDIEHNSEKIQHGTHTQGGYRLEITDEMRGQEHLHGH